MTVLTALTRMPKWSRCRCSERCLCRIPVKVACRERGVEKNVWVCNRFTWLVWRAGKPSIGHFKTFLCYTKSLCRWAVGLQVRTRVGVQTHRVDRRRPWFASAGTPCLTLDDAVCVSRCKALGGPHFVVERQSFLQVGIRQHVQRIRENLQRWHRAFSEMRKASGDDTKELMPGVLGSVQHEA